MRRYIYYLIALSLLFIAAFFFFFNDSSGNLNLRSTHFSVDNTDRISEIKIADNTKPLLLSKENNQWKVNKKFWVKEQSLGMFLHALNRIEIHYPVSKLEKSQVSSLLKKDGILVEIKKSRINTIRFYVSKPSMSQDKTFMMMANSSEPYVVKIPGFKGQISQLFISDENFWRDKIVFDYLPQNISTITVEYPKSQDKSFRIKNFNDGSFALINGNNVPETDFNVEKVARYFTYFQKIQFEDVISDWPTEKVNSVLDNSPSVQITVENIQGVKTEIKIYPKTLEAGVDEFGDKTEFDLNRAYAMLNNNKELLLIQFYTFDPLLKEIDYFR